MKRGISLFLAFAMVLSLLPISVFAAEDAALEDTPVTLAVQGASMTVSGRAQSKYIVIYDGTNEGVYYVSSSGQVQYTDGTEAAFAPGTYSVYYAAGGGSQGKTVYYGQVTVEEGAAAVSVSLSGKTFSAQSEADQFRYARSIYYNTANFNHVHIRVAGSYVFHVSGHEYTAVVSNPAMVVRVNGEEKVSHSWEGTTNYEWTYRANISRSAYIEVELTLDLTYTDSSNNTVTMEDVVISYNNTDDLDKFLHAIVICDGVEGLDFTVAVADIEEEIQYYTVSYEWRVYNSDGTYTSLPAGAPDEPASSSGHPAGQLYTYDTEYTEGSSFVDYDTGLMYTFHGWDTYSHSSLFNVDSTAAGYYTLEGITAFEITADSYIYGYWTVSQLPPVSAYVAVEKVFAVDMDGDGTVDSTVMADAEDLWFGVDTGIDLDDDGDTLVDIDYHMIQEAGGTYRLAVYQYDTPFVFTEHNADVPGFTRVTRISFTGDHISGTAEGDTATVTMEEVYQGEQVRLGTVIYTNTYTRNTADAVSEYPSLTLMKTAADTGLGQDGVVFTLYSDAECTTAVDTFTTAGGGLAFVDFTGLQAGTYYLKETSPVEGYIADPCVYTLTLTASAPVEELRNNAYVQVTYFQVDVTVPAESSAAYHLEDGYQRLHIYNEPITGSLQLSKQFLGIADEDMAMVEAVVIVHGPITRDEAGAITALGSTWELTLNQENNWSAGLDGLKLGQYLLHESFASVHGYTWTGVSYGNTATEVYNGITSAVLTLQPDTSSISLALENSYTKWNDCDFYIRKVSPDGAHLAGAVFQLYYDAACTQPVSDTSVTTYAVTGADGYAHFSGYTVPAGDADGIMEYYLQEIQAPAGYYLSDTVYKIEVKPVTNSTTRTTNYEAKISVKDGGAWVEAPAFDGTTDLLTVTNYPVKGTLTVTKQFNLFPEGINEIHIRISGPNGYFHSAVLNGENQWTLTLTDLPLGVYTVTEEKAPAAGYDLSVTYEVNGNEAPGSAVVTLQEAAPGQTEETDAVSAEAVIKNHYTRREETFEIPTSLIVKKVGENNEPLAGAEFTLVRQSDGHAVTFTTGTEGTVLFDLLSGMIEGETPVSGVYILTETKAPEGYTASTQTWTVTIPEDDGAVRVVLNEEKNVFERFWDWVVGDVSGGESSYSFAAATGDTPAVLTVPNARKLTSLTVTKTVEYWLDGEKLTDAPATGYEASTYDFAVTVYDATGGVYASHSFSLADGESKTIEDIPWGYTYKVEELLPETPAFSTAQAVTTGTIQAAETSVAVVNRYDYARIPGVLAVQKLNADTQKPLAGAGFTLYADAACSEVIAEAVSDENGKLQFDLPLANATYYLKETGTPSGYLATDAVYTVEAAVETVVATEGATPVIEARLALTSALETAEDGSFVVENEPIQYRRVSVVKVWNDGGYENRPNKVVVALYKNGVQYDTRELSEENGWSYTWEGLSSAYRWTVDELEVPERYAKDITQDGLRFTITNSLNDNPKTGDTDLPLLWCMMMTVSGLAVLVLFSCERKKKPL